MYNHNDVAARMINFNVKVCNYSTVCFSSLLPSAAKSSLAPILALLLEVDASLLGCLEMADSRRSSSPVLNVAAVDERIAMQ